MTLKRLEVVNGTGIDFSLTQTPFHFSTMAENNRDHAELQHPPPSNPIASSKLVDRAAVKTQIEEWRARKQQQVDQEQTEQKARHHHLHLVQQQKMEKTRNRLHHLVSLKHANPHPTHSPTHSPTLPSKSRDDKVALKKLLNQAFGDLEKIRQRRDYDDHLHSSQLQQAKKREEQARTEVFARLDISKIRGDGERLTQLTASARNRQASVAAKENENATNSLFKPVLFIKTLPQRFALLLWKFSFCIPLVRFPRGDKRDSPSSPTFDTFHQAKMHLMMRLVMTVSHFVLTLPVDLMMSTSLCNKFDDSFYH